jgi:hypothetical protein
MKLYFGYVRDISHFAFRILLSASRHHRTEYSLFSGDVTTLTRVNLLPRKLDPPLSSLGLQTSGKWISPELIYGSRNRDGMGSGVGVGGGEGSPYHSHPSHPSSQSMSAVEGDWLYYTQALLWINQHRPMKLTQSCKTTIRFNGLGAGTSGCKGCSATVT